MLIFVLATLLCWLSNLGTLRLRSDRTEVAIPLLWRQLAILQHIQPRPPCLPRWEQLALAVRADERSPSPARAAGRGPQRQQSTLPRLIFRTPHQG
jgi:hypothetical protein